MKACKNCSAELPDEAEFCNKCGSAIVGNMKAVDAPKSPRARRLWLIPIGMAFFAVMGVVYAAFLTPSLMTTPEEQPVDLKSDPSEAEVTEDAATLETVDNRPAPDRVLFIKDGDLWVYSISNDTQKLFMGTGSQVYAASSSPDKKKIAIVSADDQGPDQTLNSLSIADADTNREEWLVVADYPYEQPDWFPDNKHLLFRGSDGKKIINIETKEVVDFPAGDTRALSSISPDGKYVVTFEDDGPNIVKLTSDGASVVLTEVGSFDTQSSETFEYYGSGEEPHWKDSLTFFIAGLPPGVVDRHNGLYEISLPERGNDFRADFIGLGSGPSVSPDKKSLGYSTDAQSGNPGDRVLAIKNYQTEAIRIIKDFQGREWQWAGNDHIVASSSHMDGYGLWIYDTKGKLLKTINMESMFFSVL